MAILVEIEEYLVPLAHPMDQRARRCGAIRRAIEVQVEYSEPLPIPEVLEHLFQALILQAQILGAEGVWLTGRLDRLRELLESRPRKPPRRSR